MSNSSLSREEIVFLVIIFISAFVLFILNLGNIFLWQDEAQTALLSETVLEYGVPKGYDGNNYFSQELGAEYGNDYIWKWHTWFTFYLLAAFFKIFGTTTFVARLPFALFGMGCLFLLYFFTRSLLKDKKAATAAVIVLLLSVPFLILSRQCRYYSLTSFFPLGGLYGYYLMTQEKRSGPYAFFASCIFLFHTHYIYLASMLGTAAFHTLLFHRIQWKKVLFVTAGIIALNVPWIVWFSSMRYGEQYGTSMFNWELTISCDSDSRGQ